MLNKKILYWFFYKFLLYSTCIMYRNLCLPEITKQTIDCFLQSNANFNYTYKKKVLRRTIEVILMFFKKRVYFVFLENKFSTKSKKLKFVLV